MNGLQKIGGFDCICRFHRLQSARGHQSIQLIIRKGKNISAVFQIIHQGVHTAAFALRGKGDMKIGLSLVLLLKAFKNLIEQSFVLRCAPDQKVYLSRSFG